MGVKATTFKMRFLTFAALIGTVVPEALSENQSAHPLQINQFAQIDTDGDGRISKDEARAYYEVIKASVKGTPSDMPDEMPDELFQKRDADSDGHISWEEFPGPKGANPMGDEF